MTARLTSGQRARQSARPGPSCPSRPARPRRSCRPGARARRSGLGRGAPCGRGGGRGPCERRAPIGGVGEAARVPGRRPRPRIKSGTSERKVEFAHRRGSRRRGSRRRRSRGRGRPDRRPVADVVVEIGQHLLAVGVADRDGADAGADHTQGRLMQIGRQHVQGSPPASAPSSPKATAWCQPCGSATAPVDERRKPRAHQAQVDPSASSCRPSRGWRGGSRGG